MTPHLDVQISGQSRDFKAVESEVFDLDQPASTPRWQQAVSAWQQPSPSSSDFRRDVTTTATPRMLQAVISAGLNDGWSGNGAAKFEEYMAQLAGTEAGVFMISSTMGNQVGIRTRLNRPPNGIICDARSHIMHMETGGLASMSGALHVTVYPRNGLYLTLEDIERHATISTGNDACTCPTRLIHLENPLGGITIPLIEMRRIKEYADHHGMKVHIDGARLWESVAAKHGSLQEFTSVAHSVNLCLSKGLGAPVGSILVGNTDFIRHARWSLLFRGHELARELVDHWLALGGGLVVPQQGNVIWLNLDAAKVDEDE
ncbi:hypothetical protein EJ08DRAFT_673100 [Tothia fuscella]|uniref:Aromatic amino acid beta-eliminating lyase/threonine aldolase domain-containing protein n=1 Tax=Tothia fuscella TaxID=1048955 RepID=A0A9P4TTN5_9PEZI|nr:hypothetical protein EJ08DRAFT_673100 [Tothia fuscella]